MPLEPLSPWHKGLGHRIRAARLRVGLTQQQVAADLDITYQIYQRYEAGTSRIFADVVLRLAPILNTTVGAMLPPGATPPTKYR